MEFYCYLIETQEKWMRGCARCAIANPLSRKMVFFISFQREKAFWKLVKNWRDRDKNVNCAPHFWDVSPTPETSSYEENGFLRDDKSLNKPGLGLEWCQLCFSTSTQCLFVATTIRHPIKINRQTKRFYLPECKRRWFLRFVCLLKPRWQMWHLNGHVPVWT